MKDDDFTVQALWWELSPRGRRHVRREERRSREFKKVPNEGILDRIGQPQMEITATFEGRKPCSLPVMVGRANAFLDAFAHYRHSRNLPVLTVNCGAIGGVGHGARLTERLLERWMARQAG